MEVKRFIRRDERNWLQPPQRNNLYIGNFPKHFDQQKVEEFIKEKIEGFGEIKSALVKKADKIGRYQAFVAFKEDEQAENAIRALSDY